MKLNQSWLLLALPLTLAACGGADETAETPADSAIAEITPPPADPMAEMASTLAMQPTGASGVTGQATVTPGTGQTQVQVQLAGLTPGAHAGHIHSGSCETPGDVVQPLPEITADANGSGTADATLTVEAATLLDGQHVIAYHERGGGDPGAPVTCGVLIGHAM